MAPDASSPAVAVEALTCHEQEQDRRRDVAGGSWTDNDLVFCSAPGLPLDSANVRCASRSVVRRAGLDDEAWTPREPRHSFVSILSEAGVPLEEIARLVGHRSTTVTEAVCRKHLRPVLTEGGRLDHILPSTSGHVRTPLLARMRTQNPILGQAASQAALDLQP